MPKAAMDERRMEGAAFSSRSISVLGNGSKKSDLNAP